MGTLRRRESRIERIDNSDLVAGIKIQNGEAFIVIAPKCDGRIKIIK